MKSSPISKKQSSFSEAPQAQRSLLASRPFDPELEETEDAARGTHATVQQQPAGSPLKPFNFLTVPLHPATAAPANSTGAIQRQSATELEDTELEDAELQKTSIQAKLTIGQPNDKYEQEADRVASRVVNQINTPPPAPIQRENLLENEEAVQMPSLQREAMPEEEEELQMMPLQRVAGGEGMAASPDLETSIAQARGGGQPLAQSIRAPIEQAMGADFSGVKVHTDTQSDRLNRSVQAKAFTTGQDVFFRQGEYNPGSRGGQELIAHELTHVLQQGEVPGTPVAVQQGAASASVQRTFSKATSDINIDLNAEEASGGHTIERHVGKEQGYVVGRITAGGIDIASSYPDLKTAHLAITANIRANHTEINNIIFDPGIRANHTIAVRHTSEKAIGGYLDEHNVQDKKGRERKRKAFKETLKNVVIIRKLANGEGAFLLTSFPEP